MGPGVGVVEAGISSIAKAAESTVAVAKVETATGGIVQAGGVANAAELAARERLASGAEATLGAAGPDAAIEKLGGEPPVATADVSPNAGSNQPAAGSVEAGTNAAKTDAQWQEETQREAYAISQDPSQATGTPEGDWSKAEKIINDRRELAAKSAQVEQSQLTPEQQRIQQLEANINKLSVENTGLKTQIEQVNNSLTEIQSVLVAMVKKMEAKETDPKEKESWIELLKVLLKMTILPTVTEVGGKMVPVGKQ